MKHVSSHRRHVMSRGRVAAAGAAGAGGPTGGTRSINVAAAATAAAAAAAVGMRDDAAVGLEAGDHAPDKAAAYADPNYWDRRFGVETEYEWCRYAPSAHAV